MHRHGCDARDKIVERGKPQVVHYIPRLVQNLIACIIPA